MNSLQRRGLLNAAIATVATFAIGSAVVVAADAPEEVPPAATTAPSVAPTPGCEAAWEVVPSADAEDAPVALYGVTAITGTEAWAVGAAGEPEAPTAATVQRWDGTAWSAAEVPSPGTSLNELVAVDASEPSDVWAVGRTSSGFGEEPLVLRFDGIAWSEVEVPDEIDGVLSGVAAISPTDVWAVGRVGDPAASLERALVMHWDGTAWADVEVARVVGGGRSALVDIEAVTPTDLWAVGYHRFRPLIVRFDGQAWSRSETEVRGTLRAVEAFATSEVWAIGTPVQRFDGTSWREAAVARPDGVELVDVAAVAERDVWAVGMRRGQDEPTTLSVVYRATGPRWVPVDGSNVPGSDALAAVDALPDGTVLAVGWKDVQRGRRTLAVVARSCPPAA